MTAPFTPITENDLDYHERLQGVTSHRTLDGNDEGTQYSISLAGRPAWHKFGTLFDKPMTKEVGLVSSKTDWLVTVQDMTTPWIDPVDGPVDLVIPQRTARVTVNPYTGKPVVLGAVGRDLPVIQNGEVVDWGYDILGELEGTGLLASIGSFKQQRKFFCSLILPDGIRVGGQDPVNLYLTLLEHHDGEGALTAVTSATRSECANTTNIAIKNAVTRVGLRHTSGIKERMAQVKHLLGITRQYREEFAAEADTQWEQELTDLQFFDLVEHAFGERPDPEQSKTSATQWDNRFETLVGLRTDPMNAGSNPGSAWNAFQSVVSFDNYKARAQGKTDEEQQESRSAQMLLGTGNAPKVEQKAMAFIRAARKVPANA